MVFRWSQQTSTWSKSIILTKKNMTRKRCEMWIFSKLASKTTERRHWHCFSVFAVYFDHKRTFFSVCIVDFEQVNFFLGVFIIRCNQNFFMFFRHLVKKKAINVNSLNESSTCWICLKLEAITLAITIKCKKLFS